MTAPRGAWKARWIWADCDAPTDARQVIAARRTFALSAVPQRAPARVFGESAYVLYLNGAEVGRGPIRSNPRDRRYDVYDLGTHLHGGDNIVVCIGVRHASPTAAWMPGPTLSSDLAGGGLLFEADVGLDELLVTDAKWSARELPGWTTSPPTGPVSLRGRELIDSRELPSDLFTSATDDAGWLPAAERNGVTLGDPDRRHPPSYPFGPFAASPLSAPTLRELQLSPTEGGVWMLDEVAVGTLVVEMQADDGDEISISTAERLDSEGRPVPFDEDIGLQLIGRGGAATAESLDRYGLRALTVDAPRTAKVTSIRLRERVHPVTGNATFSCSDPALTRIYEVGRRTVSLCSLDAYVDCPTREQRAWTGDSVVHQMVDLTTNDDWSLARWNPYLVASPRPDGMLPMAVAGDVEFFDLTVIPDWALHWVRSVWNLYRWVGRVDEIVELLPVAERVVSWFDRFVDRDTRLPADVFGWVIIDWASVPTDGASAPLAGLLGRALEDLAEMSEFVGDAGRAERARRRHAELSRAFELFWDPQLERYADTLVHGERGVTASHHAQAAAIVGGLAPRERWGRLVELLTDRDRAVDATFSVPGGPAAPNSESPVGGAYLGSGHPQPWWDTDGQMVRAQPFFRYVVHDAFARAGRSDLIAAALLDWRVLLERCSTSWSECWFGGTTSHAWSSTPTRDLVVRVLGVTPAEPGFTVAAVQPSLGYLDWAEGVVPTPFGELSLRVDGTEIRVTSPVPAVVEGERLPAGSHRISRV